MPLSRLSPAGPRVLATLMILSTAGCAAASGVADTLGGLMPGDGPANTAVLPDPGTADLPADIADLVTSAPLVIDAVIRSAVAVEPERAVGVRPGAVRTYAEADVTGLIAGRAALSPRIRFLVDQPLVDGRAPRLAKQRVLLFAAPVAGDVGTIRLVAPDALLPWSPARDASVRAFATAAVAPDAPPRIDRIVSAYHAAGTLPGEGRTQLFVRTVTGLPLALSIMREAGSSTPSFDAVWGELAGVGAGLPAPGTLAHYRLACGLPDRIDPLVGSDAGQATGTGAAGVPGAQTPAEAAAIRQDYADLRAAIGGCERRRQPPIGAR